ncbi:putative transcription factor p65 homolog isoform X2 [Trichogramma pretiosum]|uniref:putative transcription factor p65 homolog isoform X2 n=1 Tax=Trichogramma pretiosum TaxID=7493 RepID=UPI000C71B8DB|nr:putative transcription factor p65 homolog isoform X2 [Trichogramma pretiosum]
MDRMAECNISEVLEAIKQADPENNIVSNNIDQDLNLIYPSQNQNQNMMNNYTPPGYNGKIPTGIVEIIEQPASKALRFRYKCEGRSAGSIPGVHSTPDVKTFPTIRIAGYKGKAICVVSCVTKDPPYRPHPHSLVGKENCRKGVCTVQFPQDTMTITFDKLGVQCVKKKEIEEALRVREEIRVDPFKTGFDHKKNPSSIDLNVIRLCFQVFVMNKEGKFNRGLAPVVSEPIYDKKANSDLMICKMSHCSASVHGGTEMIILCERVNKDDIQIVFYEESNGKVIWEGLGDFTPPQVHKQVGISFRTPAYHDPMIDRTVHAYVQLRRPSDGMTSESIQFNFLPSDGQHTLKRKRVKSEISAQFLNELSNQMNDPNNSVLPHQHNFPPHAFVKTEQELLTSNYDPIPPMQPEILFQVPTSNLLRPNTISPRRTPSPMPYNVVNPQNLLLPIVQENSLSPMPMLVQDNLNELPNQPIHDVSMNTDNGISNAIGHAINIGNLMDDMPEQMNYNNTCMPLEEVDFDSLNISDIVKAIPINIPPSVPANEPPNMEDSLTRLTEKTINDLCTLNNMYNPRRDDEDM